MFTVAVVNNNVFTIDLSSLPTIESLTTAVNDYVTFKEVTSDEIMTLFVDTLGLNENIMGDTSIAMDLKDRLIQIVHCHNTENLQPNGLASCLAQDFKTIFGECIILSTKWVNDAYQYDSITINDIVSVLYKKIFHTGVSYSPDNKMEKYTFAVTPSLSDHVLLTAELYGYYLILFVPNTTNKLNKAMTKLYGKRLIYDNVLVFLRNGEEEFGDIDNDILEKLLVVSEGKLSNRNVEVDPRQNRYYELSKRCEKFEKKCQGCNEVFPVSFLCGGCHRVRYHDRECQVKDRDNHVTECL